MLGRKDEVQTFVQKFESLPHKYKIVVAGNHELTFDTQKVIAKYLSSSNLKDKMLKKDFHA